MQNPNGITATPARLASSATPRPPGTAGTHLVARAPAAPQCCVHVKTDNLTGISPQNPKPGRIDCPETPTWHEREVTVIGIQGDGTGGTLARVIFEKMPSPGGVVSPEPWMRARNVSVAPKLIPVCSAGPQDKKPVGCCLAYGRDGRTLLVQCADPKHPAHNKPADWAIKQGYTLQMCTPPPAVPPCCFELGNFGNGNNARLICEDENHPAHGKAVKVTVSPDGASAAWRGQIEGTSYVLEMPVCVVEEQPEEVDCCVRNGILECPGTPYHGMSYDAFKKKYAKMRLLPCPEAPPPPPPPDCCVRIQGKRAFLVCTSGPWNGYELKPNEFRCQNTPQGMICQVVLQVPGQTAARPFMFPVCGPGKEPLPPDCCYDVGTGRLVCSDTASQYHNLQVSLVDMQSGLPHSTGYALVYHEMLGSTPLRFPICDVAVPPECCFEPPDGRTPGVKGKIVCPGSDLHGREATLIATTQLPNGVWIASVSYLGGASRMPICPPKKRPPPPSKIPPPPPPPPGKIPIPGECPPCFFCCVNLDTRRFVCPGNPAVHGQLANIQQVVEIQGSPWVVLADGTKVPGCGIKCPPPTPECPPEVIPIPTPTPGTNTPPGPKVPPPCDGPPDVPAPPPGTNTPPGPGTPPPCEGPPSIPTQPPGMNTPPGPPGAPPCTPAPPVPTQPPGTNTPPGPAGPAPCATPKPMLPPPDPGTNTPPGPSGPAPCAMPKPMIPPPTRPSTPPGPPAPPCTPDTKPTIPGPNGGTNTPPGPPAPVCLPDGSWGVPRPRPFV